MRRFGLAERKPRVGNRCPLVPVFAEAVAGSTSDREPHDAMLESLTNWICRGSVVPGFVYKKELETPDPDVADTNLRANAQLFRFMEF